MSDYRKAPFPYFGGKQHAAEIIWRALGDVAHYVEPFAGSLAVLLRRPHLANRAYFSETVNDLDGLLVNMWRAMRADPDGLAEAVSWPVSEADITARHLALVRWRASHHLERLMADPEWYDLKMAGYWLYGISAWIGGDWCTGRGPWIVGPHGGIMRRPKDQCEPGVSLRRPSLIHNGNGIHSAQLREPGVSRRRTHLISGGQGVHRPQLREPGVMRKRPPLTNSGCGVHSAQLREPGVEHEHDWHPMTMPELREWMRYLSARLRHVRIINGDWRRVVTPSALKTLPVRMAGKVAGVFLDPPYSGDVRDPDLYTCDDPGIAAEVRAWCLANGDDPHLRIVLAGFAGEGHEELEQHGWRCVEWYQHGFLRGGIANQNERGTQQYRERLWLSPHCLRTERLPLEDLWGDDSTSSSR